MFITKNGITIRIAAKDISVIGRNTQGVRVMRLAESDELIAAAKVPREDPKEEENGNGNGGSHDEEKPEPQNNEENSEKNEDNHKEQPEEKSEDADPPKKVFDGVNPDDVPSVQELMKQKEMK